MVLSRTSKEARRRLVELPGVGYKQASLFLRNVGYAKNLAILDTHVLNYLVLVGVMQSRPRSVSSATIYERIEELLRSHARSLGHSVGCIDVAIWIVMRTLSRM